MIFFYLNLCIIEDILEKINLINVYYIKLWNNNIKHFINECEELKKIRYTLINKLKELDIKSENNYI